MKFKLSVLLLLLVAARTLLGAEYYGFQTINIINLKDNTKCSGVVVNTDTGCKAVTNAHCVKGLSIGEENIIISSSKPAEISSAQGIEVFKKIIYSSNENHRSYLIKAKPSSDLAQIHFDPSSSEKFCQDDNKLNSKNTQRNLHINEVYSQQEQNQPGPILQQLPGITHSPNPTSYYRPSQNYLLMAAGFQNDLATLLSVSPVDFNSLDNLDDKMKSRLNVEYSSLPGFEFIYQVAGINLSQGMSGGALFEIETNDQFKINFKGISASFYPFQWKSNFIPASYVLDFLNDYEDDQTDRFEITLNSKEQVASDKLSAKEEEAIKKLKEEGKIPNVVSINRPIYQLKDPKGPIRVPRNQASFGDTDQDDVGGDDSLSCDWIKSEVDPFFDILPPVTNCFDLSQTRFQHTGVVTKDYPEEILIAYGDRQINGLSDLKSLQSNEEFDQDMLIKRLIGDYPSLGIRKKILTDLEGIYLSKDNNAVFNQSFHTFAHLGEGFTKQYMIKPSSNVLIRESLIHGSELFGELFENLFNYDISNNINSAHKINLKLKVSTNNLKLSIKTTDNKNYSFDMDPVFDDDYKRLTLKTTLTIYDEVFKKVKIERFNLSCDNRSFLKLVCFNDKMELGLSSSSLNAKTPLIRVAFWDGFKSKQQALNDKEFKMVYVFGEIEKSHSISRRVDLSIDFNNIKIKDLLSDSKFSPINIESSEVLSFINHLPRKISDKIDAPISSLSTESFSYRNELFHLVMTSNKKYGVLYDRSLKVVGVILKGKISTSAYDIF